MCRLSHWRRGWLQIFGIDRKVVAGYGIDGGGADDLLSGNEKKHLKHYSYIVVS